MSPNITRFDVLVVPKYMVNLLYVHKLANDSKNFIGFDEYNCYIQDLLRKEIMGKTLGD